VTLSRRSLLLAALAAGVPACTASGVPEFPDLVLATGPEGAVFREIGGALAAALAEALPNTRVTAQPSHASVENLRLLGQGTAQLGLSSLDSAVSDDVFLSAEAPAGISAVGRLYDSFLHLVVPMDSPIQTFADLAGKRVSLGPVESGTEFTGTRLLNLRRVVPHGLRMAHSESAEQLRLGNIDAFLALTGIPTPAITGLLGRLPIRMVDLGSEAKALAEDAAYPGQYVPVTIPATTYGDLGPCATVSVPNLLLARTSLPDDVVEVVTRTVFTQSERIVQGHPEASRINVRTGIATGTVPLHKGAERWFRNVKR